jgi:hypothetical protein
MEKTCIQCGIILCDKNWILCSKAHINSLQYTANKCKSCQHNANVCRYTYNIPQLKLLAKKSSISINNRLRTLKKNGGRIRLNYFGNSCEKCGVILCTKNSILDESKKYISRACKACKNNRKLCNYNYDCPKLQIISKKIGRNIEKQLRYYKDVLKSREKEKIYREKFKESGKRKFLVYYHNNRELLLNRSKKYRISLSDAYIKGLFRATYGIKATEVSLPQELIELKREQIKLYRELYSKPNKL